MSNKSKAEAFSDLHLQFGNARAKAGLDREPAPVHVQDPTPVVLPSPRTAFTALWRSLPFWRIVGLAGAFASFLDRKSVV